MVEWSFVLSPIMLRGMNFEALSPQTNNQYTVFILHSE